MGLRDKALLLIVLRNNLVEQTEKDSDLVDYSFLEDAFDLFMPLAEVFIFLEASEHGNIAEKIKFELCWSLIGLSFSAVNCKNIVSSY